MPSMSMLPNTFGSGGGNSGGGGEENSNQMPSGAYPQGAAGAPNELQGSNLNSMPSQQAQGAPAAAGPYGGAMFNGEQKQSQSNSDGPSQGSSAAPATATQLPQQVSAAALKGMVDSSSTAVLDACMRDLTRRRIAMAEAARYATGDPGRGNLLAGLASPGFDFNNMAMLGMHGLGGADLLQKFGPAQHRGSMGMEPLPHEDAAQQPKRLSMTSMPNFPPHMGQQFQQPHPHPPSLQPPLNGPNLNSQPPLNAAPGAAGPRQWWVCRVCQSKAFASAEEASEHESMCDQDKTPPSTKGNSPLPAMPQNRPNPQLPPHVQPPFSQDKQNNTINAAALSQPTAPVDASLSQMYGLLPGAATAQQTAPQQQYSVNISQDDVKSEMERFFQKQQEKLRQMQTLTAANTDNKNASADNDKSPQQQNTTGSLPFSSQQKQSNDPTQLSDTNQSAPSGALSLTDKPEDIPNPRTKPLEGPENYASLQEALPLAMPNDKDWLTPLHCFVRRHCVEVFTATPTDVATPSKGKRKPIQVGQVGIRCPHCHPHKYPYMNRNGQVHHPRERGSVYYPTTIASIYNATMNLLQRHLHSCSSVPHDIMARYAELKADDARSGTSKKYWVDSAKSLGLIDTPKGIHFSSLRPPPLPSLSQQQFRTVVSSAGRRNSLDFFSSKSNAEPLTEETKDGAEKSPKNEDDTILITPTQENSAPLVTPEDKATATGFSFELLKQMQPCVFTEADRLGKRKGLPPGFAGLACRHCFGGYGSGRFFPSSIKTLSDTSKTLNVLHNHMIRCRKCPRDVRDRLEKLRTTHDDERAKMKFGSQKAFFAQIWSRLHDGTDNADGSTTGQKKAQKQQQEAQQGQTRQLIKPKEESSTSVAPEQTTPQQLPMPQGPPPQMFPPQTQLPFSTTVAAATNTPPLGPTAPTNPPPATSSTSGVKRTSASMSVTQLPGPGDTKRMRASGA